MPPRSLTQLPPSSMLDWEAQTSSDGATSRTTLVTQRPLEAALSNDVPSRATGVLAGLRSFARSNVSSRVPQTQVSDQTFKRMRRIESLQQRVSEFVPHKPNNVPSIVASDGEAFYRNEMRAISSSPAPQHSAQAARETVRWGTGVCNQTNNVLFRAIAAEETAHARATMRDRAAARDYRPREQYPIMFCLNDDPHGFVLHGDPRDQRQAANVLVGDSWEALPVVKTWSNTEYRNRPYTVKLQTTAGASGMQTLSLSELAEIAQERVPSAEVEAYLAAQGRPPIGPALLANVYKTTRDYNIKLFSEVTSADRPDMTYRNTATNDVFTPSIAFRDYQNYRLALSKPRPFQLFQAHVENDDI